MSDSCKPSAGCTADRTARRRALDVLREYLRGESLGETLHSEYPVFVGRPSESRGGDRAVETADGALEAVGEALKAHLPATEPGETVEMPPAILALWQRCGLFLLSDREFRWPAGRRLEWKEGRLDLDVRLRPGRMVHRAAKALLLLGVLPAILFETAGLLAAGVLAVAVVVGMTLETYRLRRQEAGAVARSGGETAAWPFFSASDLAQATCEADDFWKDPRKHLNEHVWQCRQALAGHIREYLAGRMTAASLQARPGLAIGDLSLQTAVLKYLETLPQGHAADLPAERRAEVEQVLGETIAFLQTRKVLDCRPRKQQLMMDLHKGPARRAGALLELLGLDFPEL